LTATEDAGFAVGTLGATRRVGVAVQVGVGVGVAVGVAVAVEVGVAVGVEVDVDVQVGVAVQVAVGVAVAMAPIAAAAGVGDRGADASLTTVATPIDPPTTAAATAARSFPFDGRCGDAEAVKPADVTPAAGNAGDTRGDVRCGNPSSASLDVGPRRVLSPATRASASDSSAALEKRRGGSRSSARKNQASNDAGSAGTLIEGVGSGPVQIFTRRSPTLSPSNGRTPVTHLYAITPSDQRSVRWSMFRKPRACSGDM